MNILFCSSIYANKDTGLYWSIPNQVKAQGKYDNVFWYNLWMGETEEWKTTNYYHSLQDYPSGRLKDLPAPFNTPDFVVFETVYIFAFKAIVFDVWRKKIPYIVIPRSSLTAPAQKIKPVKKWIGNLLFFWKFTRKALAIQYLTENEYKESGDEWNKNHLIISNGIAVKENVKVWKKNEQGVLRGVFIGRISIYHKGLDLLIEACMKIQTKLREHSCVIHVYGPDRENAKKVLRQKITDSNINDILFIEEMPIFGQEKEHVLLSSDFFVLTSRLEGHPMGLIEALSYGLPCLVTKGTNMASEIEEYGAGWSSETSIEGIVAALEKMLFERNSFPSKSEQAVKLAKQYNWDFLGELASNKYKELLSRW